MPQIEVEEADFLAGKQVRETVAAMLKHPEARKMVLQAQKTVFPNVSIPEIDAAAPVSAELTKIQEEQAKLAKMIEDDKAQREAEKRTREFTNSMEAKKAKLRNEGWTDEGIASVMKLAEERGSADLEAMAALHDKLHPPPELVAPGANYGLNSMFAEDATDTNEMAALFNTKGEDPQALNALINKGLDEARGIKR